ncbi:hypothetical protein [Desulfosediminicola ganghwensis]|uniref:hypothetical protein n=1 Tax=Desulfosediminicola ganghwensis TaxID=2569540 RepID=UPI0010AD4FD6|nr:hypothetical protein [Desulfosediminicola ganghwensis]
MRQLAECILVLDLEQCTRDQKKTEVARRGESYQLPKDESIKQIIYRIKKAVLLMIYFDIDNAI